MKKLIIFIVILGLLFAGLYFWWEKGLSPVNPENNNRITFTVMKGEGTRTIADDLKKSGLIRDPVILFLLIKKMGIDGKLQAGSFSLSPAMTAREILQKLQVGTFDVTIVVPEGKRAEEIADTLKYNFPKFTNAWRTQLDAEEGYLFPDTYYFPKDADIDLIISKMNGNFDQKYTTIADINKSQLTKKEIITIASLVERESIFDVDRPLVASVILNRYKIGMKLDLDSTVQYSLGYDAAENSWWKKNITADDLAIDSPYNTHLNAGLPPGPISNPGMKSIMAVINAPQTDYLYFLNDKEGHNHYAKTLEEHNQNIKRYME